MRYLLVITALFSYAVFGVTPVGSPTGKVVQIVGGAKSADRNLSYGDPVYAGEVIRTESGSRVKILMSDRSIIDIGEDSAIRIRVYPSSVTAESNRELDLELGSIRASVKRTPMGKGKFFIRTKSSVLAVRGTEFGASIDKLGTLALAVFSGIVTCGSLDVTAGLALRQVAGGAAPSVHRPSAGEFANTYKGYAPDYSNGDATPLIAIDEASGRALAGNERIRGNAQHYAYNNAPGQPNGIGGIDNGNRSGSVPVALLVIYDQTPVRR